MANRMEEVARLFGLELGEHFHITKESCKDTTYKFTPEGVLFTLMRLGCGMNL